MGLEKTTYRMEMRPAVKYPTDGKDGVASKILPNELSLLNKYKQNLENNDPNNLLIIFDICMKSYLNSFDLIQSLRNAKVDIIDSDDEIGVDEWEVLVDGFAEQFVNVSRKAESTFLRKPYRDLADKLYDLLAERAEEYLSTLSD